LLDKETIRTRVWRLLEEAKVSKFPKPITGRIPNFVGSEEAAKRLFSQPEFRKAEVIKVNPDSPQAPVRLGVLMHGKVVVMPTPRLKGGFLLLNPKCIPKRHLRRASTIRGAFKYGESCPLEDLPKVDLLVVGSVAVSLDGVRVGKGGGYSELEYAILRELELIDEATPIYTTVHDLQIVNDAPREEHDLTVDVIITPTRVLRLNRKYRQPKGIIWSKLKPEDIERMPVLSKLKNLSKEISKELKVKIEV